jgi:hypothetical protein
MEQFYRFWHFIKVCKNGLDISKNLWLSEQYEIRKQYETYDKTIIGYDKKSEIFQTLCNLNIVLDESKNELGLSIKE